MKVLKDTNGFILQFIVLISLLFLMSFCKITKDNNHTDNEYLIKEFVHPGMDQNSADLEFMRQKIQLKQEPWLTAYNNLKINTNLNFIPKSYTYISTGAYNTNDIGGKDFLESGKVVYNFALMWYITQDKRYANKAIEILNAWSYKLWGFDANNAKLNVGLNGSLFLNAAEILRHTDSGWQKKDIEQFKRMLLTVFYPTIQDFFSEANGNWDAAMINTMMCIAVFTDNHQMFNRAVERYYRGEGNGGITKYIYPGGQCQEATRDWGHVQLGIGEFGKAAQVAWTQGLDFYAVANDRLAQGYEYAAQFLVENDMPAFGEISHKDMENKRDIYESIYKHYTTIKGINLPFTKQLIDKFTRKESSLLMLTATRATDDLVRKDLAYLITTEKVKPTKTGALFESNVIIPSNNTLYVNPGESIQKAIDENRGTNKWIVLKKGVHTIDQPLKVYSGMVLSGEGRESILILNSELSAATIINAEKDIHDIVIRDLLIEGAATSGTPFDPNYERSRRSAQTYPQSREGIAFMSDSVGKMKNIVFENITVQNFTKSGIFISGASDLKISYCDLDNNGSSVVPGPNFHHNLRLTRSSNCEIKNSRFDSSLWGNGISISFCNDILISDNETARNKLSGIYCADSQNIKIISNLSEGNDQNGITLEKLMDGCENIEITKNLIQYNTNYSINTGQQNVFQKENITIGNKYNKLQ